MIKATNPWEDKFYGTEKGKQKANKKLKNYARCNGKMLWAYIWMQRKVQFYD